MNSKERIDCVIAGGKPDRTPSLGGWIADPNLLMGAAGVGRDVYAKNPEHFMIKANENLGVDGMISWMGLNVDWWRIVDEHSYVGSYMNEDFDAFVEKVDALPDGAEVEAGFDFEAEYQAFRSDLLEKQGLCGDILWMPAQWAGAAKAAWFQTYGYENFFMLIGLYPQLAAKLFRIGGAQAYNRNRMIARASFEGIYPKAVLFGEDICAQRGPMISVEFLREHYAPALAHGLDPLLAAGIRPVWHCDGNVMPLLPLLIECGVQGLQGFQPECGMMIEELIKLRTREGNKLLIFGPMSVTTELNTLSSKEIAALVRRHIAMCRDEADLVYMTANTINPDVPYDNLLAMYRTVSEA